MPDVARLVAAAERAGWLGAPSDVVVLHVDPALVVRVTTGVGPRVLKAHRAGTDPAVLGQQLDLALEADPFLPPLTPRPIVVDGSLVTVWPAGEPIDQHRTEDVPWADAAKLLAAVHRLAPSPRLPSHGAPTRIARMLARLSDVGEPRILPARRIVERAGRSLPRLDQLDRLGDGAPPVGVAHGDFHLGQVVQLGESWRLIDVDDVGVGDQRWDFAWPASWFAVGLVPVESWATLIDAYRAAGGAALGALGDPWPRLDTVARAATVHIAARSILRAVEEKRELDDLDCAFVEACRRLSE